MKFKYMTITVNKKIELDKIKIQEQKLSIINNMNVMSDGLTKKYPIINPDDIILEAEDEFEQALLEEIEVDNTTSDVKILVKETDPDGSSNVRPSTSTQEFIWINKRTGEIFTCLDYTNDNNIWMGQIKETAIMSPEVTLEGIENNGMVSYISFDIMDGNQLCSEVNDIKIHTDNISLSDKSLNGKCSYFKGSASGKFTHEELFRFQDFTVCYWVKRRSSFWNMNHFWKEEELNIYNDRNGDIHFNYSDGSGNSKAHDFPLGLPNDQWVHIAIKRVHGTSSLYINGNPVTFNLNITGADFTEISHGWTQMHIGNGSRGGLKGYIDDNYFFNRGLTDNEITIIYNKFKDKIDPNDHFTI